MSDYQVIARKYRPKTFKEVLGQEAIVTTLKNAIKRKSLAHAYLFCGSRGTGKTTLARVFAKALNCLHLTEEGEPCNTCSSCLEINSGSSLDVLEIDGASHRGIDDIRQINETVGYRAASGQYKIYIIDEVHMLTKEAFNALLKTLEEPPAKVKFFFATTEPHKVLPTILSRCQRFNLNRIPVSKIIDKLRFIAGELKVIIEDGVFKLVALRAEGGLRDAESLFDQLLAFHEGVVTEKSALDVLGMMPNEWFFKIDRAAKEGNLAIAFEVAEKVFSEGKDFSAFIESIITHYRTLLIIHLSGSIPSHLLFSDEEKKGYEKSAFLYSKEQILNILELFTEALNQRFLNQRIGLETLLLKVLRIHQQIPVEFLVKRLMELEKNISTSPKTASTDISKPISNMSEDPTPTKADIPKVTPKKTTPVIESPPKDPAPIELGARPPIETKALDIKEQRRLDTLLQFAAVELEGIIQKRRS